MFWLHESPLRAGDAVTLRIGTAEARESLQRMETHLTGHKLRLEDLQLRVGRRLEFDAKQENFSANNQAANQLLTRQYRQGFAVPDRVE